MGKLYENLDNGLNADGSEIKEIPEIDSKWKHYNGIKYTILHIANLENTKKYPTTIVYQGENNKVWTRPLSDWHRSFKKYNK